MQTLGIPKGNGQNNCFCTLMKESVLADEFVMLDIRSLNVFPSRLELALKIAIWMEPNMEKSSCTSRLGVPSTWLSSGMGKSMLNVKAAT